MLKLNWFRAAISLGLLALIAPVADACPEMNQQASTRSVSVETAPPIRVDAVQVEAVSTTEPGAQTVLATTPTTPTYLIELLNLTNAERERAGLAPLNLSDSLTSAAQLHAEDLVRSNSFSHTGSDGSQPSDRALAAGYPFRYVGENIAAGGSTASITMQQWMNSAGHRANILKPEYTEVGFGYVADANTPYRHYWVQVFGSPR